MALPENIRKVTNALLAAQARSRGGYPGARNMQQQRTIGAPMMTPVISRPANAGGSLLARHMEVGDAINDLTRRNPLDLSIEPLDIDMSFRDEPGYRPERGYDKETFLDKDGKGYIPTRVIGEHGATILTFDNDVPGGPSTYLPVDGRLRDMIMSIARKSGFGSMNINSTTGGNRTSGAHPHGRAVDINNINGLRVIDPNNAENVRHLQDLGLDEKDIAENFGPAYLRVNSMYTNKNGEVELKWENFKDKMKDKKRYKEIEDGHQNHVHLSVRLIE